MDLPPRLNGRAIPIITSTTQTGLVTMREGQVNYNIVSLRLAAKGMKDNNNEREVRKKGFVPRSSRRDKAPRNRLDNNITEDARHNKMKRMGGLKKLLGHEIEGLFKNKSMGQKDVPAVAAEILSQYCSCLPFVVSFGVITSQITQGSVGIAEFLRASGLGGIAYTVLCRQPGSSGMAATFPTTLALPFLYAFFCFCSTVVKVPVRVFPVLSSWVGLWTSLFCILFGLTASASGVRGGGDLSASSKPVILQLFSKFFVYAKPDNLAIEILDAVTSVGFIHVALSSLKRNFAQASDPMNLTMPLMSLIMAWATFYATSMVAAIQSDRRSQDHCNLPNSSCGSKFKQNLLVSLQKIRAFVKDWGIITILLTFSFLNRRPWLRKFGVPTLFADAPHTIITPIRTPTSFTTSLAGRELRLVDLNVIPLHMKLFCMLPAFGLSAVLYAVYRSSSVVAFQGVVHNSTEQRSQSSNKNIMDMVALGLVTGFLSWLCLPWTICGAAVSPLHHLNPFREMQVTSGYNNKQGVAAKDNEGGDNKKAAEVNANFGTQARFTWLAVHALLAVSSVGRAPTILGLVPMPVVAGFLLFIGIKLLSHSSILQQVREEFVMTETATTTTTTKVSVAEGSSQVDNQSRMSSVKHSDPSNEKESRKSVKDGREQDDSNGDKEMAKTPSVIKQGLFGSRIYNEKESPNKDDKGSLERGDSDDDRKVMKTPPVVKQDTARSRNPVEKSTGPATTIAVSNDKYASLINCASDVELAIKVSKELEDLLKCHFQASGRGLHENISSAQGLSSALKRDMRPLATMRNKLIHQRGFDTIPNRSDFCRRFVRTFEELERIIELRTQLS